MLLLSGNSLQTGEHLHVIFVRPGSFWFENDPDLLVVGYLIKLEVEELSGVLFGEGKFDCVSGNQVLQVSPVSIKHILEISGAGDQHNIDLVLYEFLLGNEAIVQRSIPTFMDDILGFVGVDANAHSSELIRGHPDEKVFFLKLSNLDVVEIHRGDGQVQFSGCYGPDFINIFSERDLPGVLVALRVVLGQCPAQYEE